VRKVNLPSRELTYPTLGKGKTSAKVPFLGGYVSFLEGKSYSNDSKQGSGIKRESIS